MPHAFDHTPTRQDIFDEACRFFATSAGPSIVIFDHGGGHNCRYRSDEGRCCAVGHFIPEDIYVVEMDEAESYDSSTDMPNLMRMFGDRLPAWFGEHNAFLQRLQKIHDDADCWTTRDYPSAKWRYDRVVERLRSLVREAGNIDGGAIRQVWERMTEAQKWNDNTDALAAALDPSKEFNWSEVEA